MTNIVLNELIGKFKPEEHNQFCKVHDGLTAGSEHYLRIKAALAWEEMRKAALPDGIFLTLVSSTRNFERQKQIWENKWNGDSLVDGLNLSTLSLSNSEKALKIMRYSAMPGTSRHDWGTDMDLNSLEDDYFLDGEGKKIYMWLQVNASRFGFAQPYSMKNNGRPIGYEEEKWHWSYIPLSRPFLKRYMATVEYSDIDGFSGAELAEELRVIPTYVNGIAGICR
jgi:LAS superfamily LD-carboxypeptidase LdcB